MAVAMDYTQSAPCGNDSQGLQRADFHCIGVNGLGSGLNSYAHTMASFRGNIYVGTSRAILAMVRVNDPPPAFIQWPINTPENVYDLDRRAQLWRFNPRSGEWRMLFESPLVKGRTGEIVARDIGYRGSAVHQGPHDSAPALYLCTWSSSKGLQPLILRTNNGERFESMPQPSWGESINTFRAMVSFNGNLFISPTGSTAGYGQAQECVSGAPVVWCCADPRTEQWEPASPPGFGDENNLTVFEMAAFNDHLYAGTINASKGFQIWKTRAQGRPPYQWQKVVSHGAYRGNTNEIAASMCVFRGALYVGSGIINGGYDRRRKIGPAPAEIIRVNADDSWDLIVGDGRLTPDGIKYPLSAFGAGFDNFFNGYVWRMAPHEGHLYAGTFKWTVLLPYMPLDKWPAPLRFILEARGMKEIVENSAGFDLWRTSDGASWVPVTQRGFDNPYNWGARTMVSTPYGLFIGTANPFGPDIAIRTRKGWVYTPNRRGAMEVWLGTKSTSGEAHRVALEHPAAHEIL